VVLEWCYRGVIVALKWCYSVAKESRETNAGCSGTACVCVCVCVCVRVCVIVQFCVILYNFDVTLCNCL
jgi:hypothetical protein